MNDLIDQIAGVSPRTLDSVERCSNDSFVSRTADELARGLQFGESHLWYVSTDPDGPTKELIREQLASAERARADRFHSDRDRLREGIGLIDQSMSLSFLSGPPARRFAFRDGRICCVIGMTAALGDVSAVAVGGAQDLKVRTAVIDDPWTHCFVCEIARRH